MNELKKILIENNYTNNDDVNIKKENHIFTKQKKDYISIIELNDIDEIFVNFVLKRLYKNKENTEFELINQKRRKGKFINNIQNVINDEVNLREPFKELLNVDIFCSYCEETIIKNIDNCSFNNIYGFVCIYPSQGGMCISTIDEESRQKVLNELEKIPKCPDCRINQF
jgi:hypothetical protein